MSKIHLKRKGTRQGFTRLFPLAWSLQGDFWVGTGVSVPAVIWSKSGLLGFCAKLQIPCHLGHGAGFDREVWRHAVAENGRKNLKNIEENRGIALGRVRLTAF